MKTLGQTAYDTLKIAANTLIVKGEQVQLDAAGRAAKGTELTNLPVVGIAFATIDNRTGSPLGGAADAADVVIEQGAFEYAAIAGSPIVGAKVYCSGPTSLTTTIGATRGKAGIIKSKTVAGTYYVLHDSVTSGLM
jgi:hypothetical protein